MHRSYQYIIISIDYKESSRQFWFPCLFWGQLCFDNAIRFLMAETRDRHVSKFQTSSMKIRSSSMKIIPHVYASVPFLVSGNKFALLLFITLSLYCVMGPNKTNCKGLGNCFCYNKPVGKLSKLLCWGLTNNNYLALNKQCCVAPLSIWFDCAVTIQL